MGDPIPEAVRPEEPLRVLADQDLLDEGRTGRDQIRDDPEKSEDHEHERSQCRPQLSQCRSAAFEPGRHGRRHEGGQSWRSLAEHRTAEARIGAEKRSRGPVAPGAEQEIEGPHHKGRHHDVGQGTVGEHEIVRRRGEDEAGHHTGSNAPEERADRDDAGHPGDG